MKRTLLLLMIVSLYIQCKTKSRKDNDRLHLVTTTTMITNLVNHIGGDKVVVQGLMGAGVDPHLYKASEGDVTKLFNADVVIYNGLHLEGKLEEVFEKMEHQNKKTIVIADALDKNTLIHSENFASNYDPHIWFDIENWKHISRYVAEQLSELDPDNAVTYKQNLTNYLKALEELSLQVTTKMNELPKPQRILVTAHDAFNYFGRQHQFQVVGLQGLSTATEAGVQDVQKLASFIIKNNIKAIFVESSVPKRTIKALQRAVTSKGHEVRIGGTLYSDALGSAGTKEATYIGMYMANVNTIVDALK